MINTDRQIKQFITKYTDFKSMKYLTQRFNHLIKITGLFLKGRAVSPLTAENARNLSPRCSLETGRDASPRRPLLTNWRDRVPAIRQTRKELPFAQYLCAIVTFLTLSATTTHADNWNEHGWNIIGVNSEQAGNLEVSGNYFDKSTVSIDENRNVDYERRHREIPSYYQGIFTAGSEKRDDQNGNMPTPGLVASIKSDLPGSIRDRVDSLPWEDRAGGALAQHWMYGDQSIFITAVTVAYAETERTIAFVCYFVPQDPSWTNYTTGSAVYGSNVTLDVHVSDPQGISGVTYNLSSPGSGEQGPYGMHNLGGGRFRSEPVPASVLGNWGYQFVAYDGTNVRKNSAAYSYSVYNLDPELNLNVEPVDAAGKVIPEYTENTNAKFTIDVADPDNNAVNGIVLNVHKGTSASDPLVYTRTYTERVGTFHYTLQTPAAGDYFVTASASDIAGTVTRDVSITVQDTPPLISLLSPQSTHYAPHGETFYLKAYADDNAEEDDIDYVHFQVSDQSDFSNLIIDQQVSQVSQIPREFLYQWDNAPLGTYYVKASAMDYGGNLSEFSNVHELNIRQKPVLAIDSGLVDGTDYDWGTLPLSGTASTPQSGATISSVDITISGNTGNKSIHVPGDSWDLTDLDLPPGTYTIEIKASDDVGIQSDVSSFSITVNSFEAAVNFQANGSTTPADMVADTGAQFDDRGNGYSYGWLTDRSGSGVERTYSLPEEASDHTFISLGDLSSNYQWEIAVPNGMYTVSIVSGDPEFTTSDNYQTAVEGVTAIAAKPVAEAIWQRQTLSVPVNDNKLTITNLTAASGNVVNSIVIKQVSTKLDTGNYGQRFSRGSGGDATYHSFVIPIDFQKGIQLPLLDESNPERLHHYNADLPGIPFEFNNPIAEFGSEAGGSPLYTGRGYRFGVHVGDYKDFTDRDGVVRIRAYNSSGNLEGTTYLDIPSEDDAEWATFALNGFVAEVEENGLKTVLSYVGGDDRWDADNASFILMHLADNSEYTYFVDLFGAHADGNMVFSPTDGTAEFAPMYSLSFDSAPFWLVNMVSSNFEGEPLPPFYYGKSPEELAAVKSDLPTVTLDETDLNYLSLGESPELRSHTLLDRFVDDMSKDPIALINYVHNEIDLVDAIGLNPSGQSSQVALYPEGVKRSAFAVYQEGAGSPIEQCALLVYLLRKSEVPAAYMSATPGAIKMLDTQVSRLLRTNISNTPGTPEQIPVNYPWVVAYIDGQWRHFFPWIKDTLIEQGESIDALELAPGYLNGAAWTAHYLAADPDVTTAIDNTTDQVSVLYPKFLESLISSVDSVKSLDDLGLHAYNRKNTYHLWEDFPRPFFIDQTASFEARKNLVEEPGLFDTVNVRIFPKDSTDPNDVLDTGTLFLADVHNRPLTVFYTKELEVSESNSLNLSLVMDPYDNYDIDGPVIAWPRSDAYTDNNNIINKYLSDLQVGDKNDSLNDLNMSVEIIRSHGKIIAPENATTPASSFWQLTRYGNGHETISLESKTVKNFLLGDAFSLNLNYGRVSNKMMNYHMNELRREELRKKEENTQTQTDVYYSNVLYTAGAAYWKNTCDFDFFISKVHGLHFVSDFGVLFTVLRPDRGIDGAWVPDTNGLLRYREPAVELFQTNASRIFNGTIQPNSGQDSTSALSNYSYLKTVNNSVEEHSAIQSIYKDAEAYSAAKLIRDASQRHLDDSSQPDIIYLSKNTYESAGSANSNFLKNEAGVLWDQVEAFFESDPANAHFKQGIITPGKIVPSGSDSTTKALGLILFSDDGLQSGSFINGGVGQATYDNVAGAMSAKYLPGFGVSIDNEENVHIVQTDGSGFAPFEIAITESASDPEPFNTQNFSVREVADWSQFKADIASGNIIFDPATSDAALKAYEMIYGSPSNPGSLTGAELAKAIEEMKSNNVVFPNNQQASASNNPLPSVNIITGEYFLTETDFSLPSAIGLSVDRNYVSTNKGNSEFGYGWKPSFLSHMSISDDGNKINAAEPDGSVVVYSLEEPGGNVWKPLPADNPGMANTSNHGTGAAVSFFNANIERVTEGDDTFYKIHYPDGSKRIYKHRTVVIGDLDQSGPYVHEWIDQRGNKLAFEYGEDSRENDYGRIKRIESSSGPAIGFYYNMYGHIIEAFTTGGLRVYYEYNQFADLTKVTWPDGTTFEYEYEILLDPNKNNKPYSTHRILRRVFPEGRFQRVHYYHNVTLGDGSTVLMSDSDAEAYPPSDVKSTDIVFSLDGTIGADMEATQMAYLDFSNRSYQDKYFNGHTILYDAYNHPTEYHYENSLITKTVQKVTQAGDSSLSAYEIIQEWYAPDYDRPEGIADNEPDGFRNSVKRVITARGLTTEYKYDAKGNRIRVIVSGDLDGDGVSDDTSISKYEYDQRNFLIREVDPMGNGNNYFYEGDQTEDPHDDYLLSRSQVFVGETILSETRFEYENVVETDDSDEVIKYSNGLLKRRWRSYEDGNSYMDPDSNEALEEYVNDARGFKTEKIGYTGTSDPDVRTVTIFDDHGQPIKEIDPSGSYTRRGYDAMGQNIWTENYDENDVKLSSAYTYFGQSGEVVWQDGPKSDPEDYVLKDYDGAGRLIAEITWRTEAKADGSGVQQVDNGTFLESHAITQYFYDKLGNIIKQIDPEGHFVTFEYDEMFRLRYKRFYHADEDPVSGTPSRAEEFRYDLDDDNPSISINPLGLTTQYFYTSDGRSRRTMAADGTIAEVRYGPDGRELENIVTNDSLDYVNGEFASKVVHSYDEANLTSTVSRFDSDGNVFSTASKIRDTRGNIIKVIDTYGNETITKFDDLDRVIYSEGPAGTGVSDQQFGSRSYDPLNSTTTIIDANGDYTVQKDDAMGRPTFVNSYTSGDELFSVVSYVYDPNYHWVETYAGDENEAQVVKRTYGDTFGGTVLEQEFSDVLQSEYKFSIKTYDRRGKPLTSQDSLLLVTNYETDEFGQIIKEVMPDGAETTFEYNALGSLLARNMPEDLSQIFEYDALGKKIRDYTKGKEDKITRNHRMTYILSGKNKGLQHTITDPRGVVFVNSYDDFGRIVKVVADANSVEGIDSVTTETVYDKRDLPISVTQYSNKDQEGQTKVLNRYDAYGQLIETETRIWDENHIEDRFSHLTQSWDALGRRSNLAKGDNIQTQGTSPLNMTYAYHPNGTLKTINDSNNLYQYARFKHGGLKSRSNPWRVEETTELDALGRPNARVTRSALDDTVLKTEYLTYLKNNKLESHTILREGALDSAIKHLYSYNNARSKLLKDEVFRVVQGGSDQLLYKQVYSYDNDQAGGLGKRTKAEQVTYDSSRVSPATSTEYTDNWGRMASKTLLGANAPPVTQSISGKTHGGSRVDISVDGNFQKSINVNNTTPITDWITDISLFRGQRHISAQAYNANGEASEPFTSQVTVKSEDVIQAFDDSGNVISRTWVREGKVEHLKWDALGRLIEVEAVDINNANDPIYKWAAQYDPVNRRIITESQEYQFGLPKPKSFSRTESWFDPLVEFLEIAVDTGAGRQWKIYGPDANGFFGAFQGVGGLEALIKESDGETIAILNDNYGNVTGHIKNGSGVVLWSDTLYNGYGPNSGEKVNILRNGVELVDALGWQGRHMDITGFFNLGARHYDPASGRFLSPDPLGFSEGMDLYQYGQGDPINFIDPDGRGLFSWIGGFFKSIFRAIAKIVKKVVKFVKKYWKTIVQVALTMINPALGMAFSMAMAYADGGIKGLAVAAAFSFIPGGGTLAAGITRNVVLKTIVAGTIQGVISGVRSKIMGGSFSDGFKAGFISGAVGVVSDSVNDSIGFDLKGGHEVERALTAAAIGGAVAELTGGDFADGAVSSAAGQIMRDVATKERWKKKALKPAKKNAYLEKIDNDPRYGQGGDHTEIDPDEFSNLPNSYVVLPNNPDPNDSPQLQAEDFWKNFTRGNKNVSIMRADTVAELNAKLTAAGDIGNLMIDNHGYSIGNSQLLGNKPGWDVIGLGSVNQLYNGVNFQAGAVITYLGCNVGLCNSAIFNQSLLEATFYETGRTAVGYTGSVWFFHNSYTNANSPYDYIQTHQGVRESYPR